MKKQETKAEFESRVRAVAKDNGLNIKDVSDEFVATRIRGEATDTSNISNVQIAIRLPAVYRENPKQFIPEKAAPTPFRTGMAAANLDFANKAAALAAPPKPQRTILTPAERERARRWGAGAALDLVNERAVPYIHESNKEEGDND